MGLKWNEKVENVEYSEDMTQAMLVIKEIVYSFCEYDENCFIMQLCFNDLLVVK